MLKSAVFIFSVLFELLLRKQLKNDYETGIPRTLIPLRMRVRVVIRRVSRRVPVPLSLVSKKSFF